MLYEMAFRIQATSDNDEREILNFMFTPRNINAGELLKHGEFLGDIKGKLRADDILTRLCLKTFFLTAYRLS